MPTAENPSKSATTHQVYPRVRHGRPWNIAILKILDSRGSLLGNLSVLTGLSCDSLKARAKRVRWNLTEDEQRDHPADELDPSDRRYLSRYFRDSSNPEVQAFLAENCSLTRRRPDWRSSHDADNRPVGKARRPKLSA
jgi:hypothetical protein